MRKGTKSHQKPLAQAIAENMLSGYKKTASEVLESVGMSKITAKNQIKRTIQAKGVQKELEAIGFTSLNAKVAVAKILNSPIVYEMVTPDNQLRAAREIFMVNGDYAPEKLDIRKVVARIVFKDSEDKADT